MAYFKREGSTLIIKRHLIYVDAKSVRKVGPKEEKEEDSKEKELEELKRKIVEEAKEEAKKIVENARRESEEIVKKAREDSERMKRTLEEEYTRKIGEIEDLKGEILRIADGFKKELARAAEEIADLSLPVLREIYRKILEKDIDEDLARRRITSILERIYETAGVRVRISPGDSEILGETVEELKKRGFEVLVDPSLKMGDVVVETQGGVFDRRTDFLWKMIEDAIDEIL